MISILMQKNNIQELKKLKGKLYKIKWLNVDKIR